MAGLAKLKYVRYETAGDGRIVIARMNKPEKNNAICSQMYRDLTAVLDHAERTEKVSCVVLTGTGKYFSSGADLTDVGDGYDDSVDSIDASVGKFMQKVLRFPKVLAAAVNGGAVGIGVTVLAHCDFVVGTPDSTYWTPFIRIGVIPEFCSSVTFPAIMGTSLAWEMLALARKLNATEALKCGLISRIAKDPLAVVCDSLLAAVNAPFGAQSLIVFKRVLKVPKQEELERAFRLELLELDKRLRNGTIAEAVSQLLLSKL